MRKLVPMTVIFIVFCLMRSEARGQAMEPPALADLHASPLVRLHGTVRAVRPVDGPELAARGFTIELPNRYHSRNDLAEFGGPATFDIDFGSPRFYVSRIHEEEVLGAHLEIARVDFDQVVDRGERNGLTWISRVSTMQRRAFQARRTTMRPLPPGERTWTEIEIVSRSVTADGTLVRCAADLVPFSAARHGSTARAIDWLLERCATVHLD